MTIPGNGPSPSGLTKYPSKLLLSLVEYFIEFPNIFSSFESFNLSKGDGLIN